MVENLFEITLSVITVNIYTCSTANRKWLLIFSFHCALVTSVNMLLLLYKKNLIEIQIETLFL